MVFVKNFPVFIRRIKRPGCVCVAINLLTMERHIGSTIKGTAWQALKKWFPEGPFPWQDGRTKKDRNAGNFRTRQQRP